jgi:branched-subunit amino acid aminotransferase/4-amino-4-deoxychorismate lyase
MAVAPGGIHAPGPARDHWPVAHIEIDGRDATVEQLRAASVAHYGHFTAMQVRDRRVRGLDLHLARLDAANREVFGAGLDTALVRDHVRHALGEATRDASVRVHVYETPDGTAVMVIVRPPQNMRPTPWRLQTVPYQRPAAHIKHLADFGQGYFRRLAGRNGCDEALLTGPGGVISEGSLTNICFIGDVGAGVGAGVAWPDAPALRGVTMQILERTLPGHGVPSRRVPVYTADLGSFTAAFVTNSWGIAPVKQIDDLILPVDDALTAKLTEAYESAGWDGI